MAGAVKMNAKGVRAVLTHPAIVADIDRRGEAIATAAGKGFTARKRPRRLKRYGNNIWTANDEAREKQADDNALIRALGAGR